MMIKTFSTLLGVMAIILTPCAADTNQSEHSVGQNQPMKTEESEEGQRETPEVLLQLKYDGGELDRIYLTQFRKENRGRIPPVSARTSLCSDLCFAGLGGNSCGLKCPEMVPVALTSALLSHNDSNNLYGEPRVAVCPALCKNGLGQPLCNCQNTEVKIADWSAVCGTFCAVDKYVLRGCPACEVYSDIPPMRSSNILSLNTADGWRSWCNTQCRHGQGGAACNCDRAPFQ